MVLSLPTSFDGSVVGAEAAVLEAGPFCAAVFEEDWPGTTKSAQVIIVWLANSITRLPRPTKAGLSGCVERYLSS